MLTVSVSDTVPFTQLSTIHPIHLTIKKGFKDRQFCFIFIVRLHLLIHHYHRYHSYDEWYQSLQVNSSVFFSKKHFPGSQSCIDRTALFPVTGFLLNKPGRKLEWTEAFISCPYEKRRSQTIVREEIRPFTWLIITSVMLRHVFLQHVAEHNRECVVSHGKPLANSPHPQVNQRNHVSRSIASTDPMKGHPSSIRLQSTFSPIGSIVNLRKNYPHTLWFEGSRHRFDHSSMLDT